MLENLIIRPVELKDARQFRDNLYTRNTLEQIEALIVENIQKSEEKKLVHMVAVLEGEIVGTAILTKNSHPLRSHRAEVGGLVVKYELWGRGIARRLIEECKRLAGGMGVNILEVSCRGGEQAEIIYRHLGFIEYSRMSKGLIEPWNEHQAFDDAYLYQPI